MNYSILDSYDLPTRHCVEHKKASGSVQYRNIKDLSDSAKSKGEQKPLVDTMEREMSYHHIQSEAQEPTLNLVFHEKRDGLVAAKGVYDRVKKSVPEAQLNPDFDEKRLSSFIKPSSIKRIAVAENIWNGTGNYTVKDFKTAVITAVTSLIGFVLTFFDVTGIFNFTINFAGNEHALTYVFASIGILLAAVALVSFVLVRKEHFAKDMENFEKSIAEDDDDTQFLKLVDNLEQDDFLTFGSGGVENVYVINLSEASIYTPRKRKILQRYLSVMQEKQCWFVFLEACSENNAMLSLSAAKIFTLVKLGMKKKREIAQQVYEKTGTLIYDSMLGHYGVDAIFGKQLNVGATEEDINLWKKRVEEFAEKYSDYNIRVKRLVYFVADLSVKYHINFENPKLWQYLFRYTEEGSAIEAIDKKLVRYLFYKDSELVKEGHYNQIEKIIVDIVISFGDIFTNLSENNPYADAEGGEYVQLCLVKAMRVKKQDDERRLCNIATIILDNIYELYRLVCYEGEYGALCDFSSGEWGRVVLHALSVFEAENYRWFSPEIVHAFLMLYGAAEGQSRPTGILSCPEFLNAARSNLILGPNIHGGEADDSTLQVSIDGAQREIDPVYDHYLTVKYAVAELKLSEKSTFGNTPAFFDIIRMKKTERDEYYIALSRLGEDNVLRFFANLYDTFCASSRVAASIKFCCYGLYQNDISAKYKLSEDTRYVSDLTYVELILDKMFLILRDVYSADSRILARLTELHEMYRSDDADINERLLLELAESEFVGISVFSYLICMSARVRSKRRILENMYLGIGNYLIRFIFLIYHESAVNSLNNSDFKYMALILNSYDEPGDAVLGYLCWCGTQIKPSETGGLVTRYLSTHLDRCVANLETVVEDLHVRDFEDFISYLVSSDYLEKEQKAAIYEKIITVLRTKYTYDERVALCIELATLLGEGKRTEEFAAFDDDELVRRLTDARPDSCYLICREYIKMDEARFYPLCARLVARILASSFVASKDLLIRYLYYVMQKEEYRGDFASVLSAVLASWAFKLKFNDMISYNATSASLYARFLASCLELDYLNSSLKQQIDFVLDGLKREHSFFLELESNERFFMRSWEKLSIVNLLVYLLEKSTLPRANSRWSEGLSQEERYGEIADAAYNVKPIVSVGGDYCVNVKYLDILRAISTNDNGVQFLVDEDAIINKLLADAVSIVEHVFDEKNGARVKLKLQRISSAYRRL